MVNLLPFSLALLLAYPVGIFLSLVLTRQRRVCLENLREAFGREKSEKEITALMRASFVHVAEFTVEWLRLPKMAARPERYLSIRHADRVQNALKEGKGAVILASHTGNWEIMALMVGLLIAQPIGAPIYSLARPLKNTFLYNHTIRMRGLTGLGSIDKTGGVRETFRHLKKNHIVCMVMDQRVREGGIEANFFGRPALTTSLPALINRRLGTPIFHVFINRHPGQKYEMTVEGPVRTATVGERNDDVLANTQLFNNRLEQEIRKDPAEWLWMHNRWRI